MGCYDAQIGLTNKGPERITFYVCVVILVIFMYYGLATSPYLVLFRIPFVQYQI